MSVNYLKKYKYKTDTYKDSVVNPAASVFVSANAGTGKTSLLTKRVLSLLLHGVSPARILCLTYTKAAAAEMEQRVLGSLGTWVMADEKTLRQELTAILARSPDDTMLTHARGLFATVLDVPESVRIQTLHGFCQTLLKRFPLEAGVSPQFSVMDSRTEQEMLKQARLQLFADASGTLKEAIAHLAAGSGGGDFDALLATLAKHKFAFRALFSRPGGLDAAIDEVRALLAVERDGSLESLIEKHFAYDAAVLAELRRIAEILSKGEKTDRTTAAVLADWLSAKDAATRMVLVERYTAVFVTQKNTAKDVYTKKAGIDQASKELLDYEGQRVIVFAEAYRALNLAARNEAILRLAEALLALYDGIKRRHARMDYDDLILAASELLERPGHAAWVLFKLDGGIDHVLVDEAQDTNPAQWGIIQALVGDFFAGESKSENDRSIFVVGDEKQSIFSFQGAEVRLLSAMQGYFGERIEAAGQPVDTISLTKSYRSLSNILQAADAVFGTHDTPLRHIPTRAEHDGLVELWPVIASEDASPSAQTQLVNKLADTIRDWLKNGLWLEARNRAVTAGDIMILVRTRTALVDKLTRALKRRGVPVAGVDRMELTENLAVQDLIALGEVLLLPEDDLTLAAVLKSPVCNIDEETLFALAAERGDKTLWERLHENAPAADALALLKNLRAKADFMPPYELYAYALGTLGLRNRFTGRMGEEYADAIDEFLSQALVYEQENVPSLQGFLHWLKNSKSEIKRDMEQSKRAVRIMTVHGAKGLQAPVVILPDTVSKPDMKDRLHWSGMEKEKIPLWLPAEGRDCAASALLRAGAKERMMEEYRRLLYVAMTRAEDHLYICGATGEKNVSDDSWYQLIRRGLEPQATACETPVGEGLRLGNVPLVKTAPSLTLPLEGEGSARKRAGGGGFAFLSKPTPAEPSPPKPLAPSRLGEEPPAASPANPEIFVRGLFIHALLQYLPDVPKKDWESVARGIAAPYRNQMSDSRIENCMREAMALIENPEFAAVFSPGAVAEAPITGTVQVNGAPVVVSGKIDRLVISKKEIWIVDYKTNQIPPDANSVPLAYRRQMALYRLLLQEIFPKHAVRAALLWTAIPRMDILDEAALKVLE